MDVDKCTVFPYLIQREKVRKITSIENTGASYGTKNEDLEKSYSY